MYLAYFYVPHPGRYNVRLRVIFDDGRQGEKRVQFELQDWFIASIGDSFAGASATSTGRPKSPEHQP